MSMQIIKKIKVALEYSNKTVNEEVDPYKTINFIKERAMRIFYPLNSEFRLLYLNKDLTSYENIPLGEYFRNKGSIQIKIKENIKRKSNNLKAMNNNQFTNYYNNNILEVNKDNPNFENVSRHKEENLDNRNYKTNEEFLKKIQKKDRKSVNKLKTNKIDKNIINEIDANNLCHCTKDVINFYCRTCNVFLCKNCRIDLKHQTHKSLHVDVEHPEESVKLYAITLQSDINLNMKAGKIYSNNFQNKKFIDIESRKEIIVRKLDEIERRLEERMRKLPQVDEKEFSNLLSNLQKRGKDAKEELEEILDLIYKNNFKYHNKLSFDEMLKYFQNIFQKEREIEDLSNSILAFKINYDIHRKIDDMYKIIEKEIDNVLLTDLKENKNLLDNTYMFSPEMIRNLKNYNTAYKGGDMSMEKKIKKKEDIVDGVINLKNNENSIFNKSELSMKHNEENYKRNIIFKRTIIEAVDKNKFNLNKGDSFEDIPSGIDMEYNSKIRHHSKKLTNKKVESIDSNYPTQDEKNVNIKQTY